MTATNLSRCPREAAFKAIWVSSQGDAFADQMLDSWRIEHSPSQEDARLARQITYGTIQMAVALDHLAGQLTAKGKLSLKTKERILLRCALYQAHYMERIPPYAIVDQTIRLAKKYCHSTFVGFLNAILRSYYIKKPSHPSGFDSESISKRYSYSTWYVDKLLEQCGKDSTLEILELGNAPAKIMVRLRDNVPPTSNSKIILEGPLPVIIPESIDVNSTDYYIQNVTQAYLIGELSKVTPPPSNILDLCAAPGGKTLAAADLYPDSKISANDISEARLTVLKNNIEKYGLKVTLSCCSGEEFSTNSKYDLVIIDAPCSNSGVLNKRAEARWRLTSANVEKLHALQLRLLSHATKLLSPQGQIWYLTCSILSDENEELIAEACRSLPIKVGAFTKTILPNSEGWDGGFACQLVQRD